MSYGDFKELVAAYSGLEKDALHIHLALLLYIVAMFLFQQSRRSRFPWLFVFALEIANEMLDLRRMSLDGGALKFDESAKDLWNTMIWPTVLLLVGRYTDLFQHRLGTPAAG